MTQVYSIADLELSYGGPPVLSVDRLEIPSGEIVALVGPNGAGKTTLLHALAFVQTNYRGTIRFFGEIPSHRNLIAYRRQVGLLLQNPYLFHASVLSNVLWGLHIRGIPKSVGLEKALAALERVGLSGFELRNARELSGGESQRLAFARALALEPEVFLLDEPGNHMDRESIRRTEEIVKELNRDQGKTIILTTHNLAQAHVMADRVLSIVQGRVVTASLENLFRGSITEAGIFDTGRIRLRVPPQVPNGTHLSLDPAKIGMSTSAGPDVPVNGLSGTIVNLSLQDDTSIKVGVDAGEVFSVLLNRDSGDVADLTLGRRVVITVNPEDVRVFSMKNAVSAKGPL